MKVFLRWTLVVLGALAVVITVATPDHRGLVAQLGAPTASERDAAAKDLLALGDAALPALNSALGSGDAAVRERARAILEILTTGTGPGSPARRRRAAAALRSAMASPRGLQRGSKCDGRLAALWPESGEILARAMRKRAQRELVGDALAGALARHATSDGVLTLVDLLTGERLTPSAALRAGRELDRLLAKPDGRERIGDARAIAADRAEAALDQTSAPLRRGAVAVYAALAGRDGSDRLAKLARDADPGVRAESARAIGRLRRPAAPLVLRRLARDIDPTVRAAAVAALGRSRPEELRAAVTDPVDDPSPSVRAAYADVLARHAATGDRRDLERLLADDSARVRAAARRALATLATLEALETGDTRNLAN